jgi:hypothetical protein
MYIHDMFFLRPGGTPAGENHNAACVWRISRSAETARER